MNNHHELLLDNLQAKSRPLPKKINLSNYLGTSHHIYNVKTSEKRKTAKAWAEEYNQISTRKLTTLLTSLYTGKSFEEKTITAEILRFLPEQRRKTSPLRLDTWLSHLEGWAEIDITCQNIFTAEEVLNKWKPWHSLLKKLNRSKNINKRRASLVLLITPTKDSRDTRLSCLAFENIDNLKKEDSVLITKAISWLLRALITHHKKEVSGYIKSKSEALPRLAIREVTKKLKTGKKS